jgi:hypothetical protein
MCLWQLKQVIKSGRNLLGPGVADPAATTNLRDPLVARHWSSSIVKGTISAKLDNAGHRRPQSARRRAGHSPDGERARGEPLGFRHTARLLFAQPRVRSENRRFVDRCRPAGRKRAPKLAQFPHAQRRVRRVAVRERAVLPRNQPSGLDVILWLSLGSFPDAPWAPTGGFVADGAAVKVSFEAGTTSQHARRVYGARGAARAWVRTIIPQTVGFGINAR